MSGRGGHDQPLSSLDPEELVISIMISSSHRHQLLQSVKARRLCARCQRATDAANILRLIHIFSRLLELSLGCLGHGVQKFLKSNTRTPNAKRSIIFVSRRGHAQLRQYVCRSCIVHSSTATAAAAREARQLQGKHWAQGAVDERGNPETDQIVHHSLK